MIAFAENVYSFRLHYAVLTKVAVAASPDEATLATIEDRLLAAANAYRQRRYQEAIDAYKEAEALIYAHLDPGWSILDAHRNIELGRDPDLFVPLLSGSLEWLNVLGPKQPTPVVRPRVGVDLTSSPATKFEGAGLVADAVKTSEGVAAAADWQLSRTLDAAGNPDAGAFFRDRAALSQPDVIASLDRAASTRAAVSPSPIDSDLRSRALTIAAREPLPAAATVERSFGIANDDGVKLFAWKAGEAPPLDKVKAFAYENRVTGSVVGDILLHPIEPADVALSLPHAYYYTIPLGLAECYHALGDWEQAEKLYFQASSYQYLNVSVEAPYVFVRLATLYLDWGVALYRVDEVQDALTVFSNVMTPTSQPSSSRLFTTPALKPGADAALKIIDHLDAPTQQGVNPVLAAAVMGIHQQLVKLHAGLDYWGHHANSIPIWTFDYLQRVAINFAQLAISAERDVVNFWSRADAATLTRDQLTQAVGQAGAEEQAAELQAAETDAEVLAFDRAAAVAKKRSDDAHANATEYANTSRSAIVHQALASQLSGGEDGDASQLNALADTMTSGSYSLEGARGTLAAAETLSALRLNRQYEVDSMNRQAAELDLAKQQADAELVAAQARRAAAQAGVAVAQLRADDAQESLDAFDAQIFTPDVWYRMGDAMMRLYQRYFDMALRSARLMQRAYNFENDVSLHLIRSDYSSDEVKGLLGADVLMADIQTFTFELVTSGVGKPQPMRQSISLAQSYGFAFENQLRKTGTMSFETRIDDFDGVYPGTYNGRIQGVEVSVEGLVPPSGISGTLTNDGISGYRTPSSVWTQPGTSGLKYRVQPRETLVLTDYDIRRDGLLTSPDTRMLRVFEGAGLASTWVLDLPPAVNDLDYATLTDVKLTLYYQGRYDPELKDRVLADLATHPGVNERQWGIPLRWLYPDAFFRFLDTGVLALELRAADFRRNETKPQLTSLDLLIVTDSSGSAAGIALSLSTPSHPAPVKATTGLDGSVRSDGGPFAPLAAGSALGSYTVTVDAADNPALAPGGNLHLTPVVNVALVIGYSYTPRG